MTKNQTRQPAAAHTAAKRVRYHGCWWDLRYPARSK
jgi:hypothetical protein